MGLWCTISDARPGSDLEIAKTCSYHHWHPEKPNLVSRSTQNGCKLLFIMAGN